MIAGVTSPMRTLIDCVRTLPFGAALAIADSALRNGGCDQAELGQLATLQGPGAVQARRVAEHANGAAANPFESVLRALCIEVGLDATPQVPIYQDHGSHTVFLGRPDLLDRGRRLILEAESYEYHGGRKDLARDCRRFNRFQLGGFRCGRFPWEDTLYDQDGVRETLLQLAEGWFTPVVWAG